MKETRISTGIVLGLTLLATVSSSLETTPAQSEFTLAFSGPDILPLSDGTAQGEYFCTLTHSGSGAGAQGWSISLTADGGGITAIGLGGTTAEPYFNQGFLHNELTNGPGNTGAISAVVLSFFGKVELPANSTNSLARLQVQRDPVPGQPDSLALRYVDGLRGLGEPVLNLVTQSTFSSFPALGSKTIALSQTGGTSGDDACPISLVDKVQGILAGGAAADSFSFSALGGTLLDVKLKVTVASSTLGLSLSGPQGSAVDLAPFTVVRKTTINVKKVLLPSQGTYTVTIEDAGGTTNPYFLQLKGKTPKEKLSVKGLFGLAAPGTVIEQEFSALAGSQLKLALKGKGTLPEILGLVGPSGEEIALGADVHIPGVKTAKIQGFTFPVTGNHTLRFTGQGQQGSLSLSIKMKKPATRVLEECDR